jgi:ribosomal protein S12 methylthiotransferase
LGVFIYQKEKGTLAGQMKNQISQKIKKNRFNKLMKTQMNISKKRNKNLIGKTIDTIIEGEKNGYYFGRTFRDAPDIDGKIFIKKIGLLIPGEIAKAKITAAKIYDLIGETTHLSSRT